jgi:peptidoglycan hydrolase-like protein with peptidoglycan-binding domain
MRTTILVIVAAVLLAGCNAPSAETRAKEQLEKMKESIPDVEAAALGQKVTAEQVKRAQEALKKSSEYLGEANGKLDAVTVNSIEAFQTAHGLKADGMLNEKTERLLQDELAKK